MRLKTIFQLRDYVDKPTENLLLIIGKKPENRPYVSIQIKDGPPLYVADSDLELMAVNILKSLNSKRLTNGK